MKIVSYRGCFPLFIILLVLLSSCTLERKLAKDYLRNHKGNAIMIVPAWGIYKQNLTVDIDSIGKYTNQQLDSIAWNQSALVKKISDSIFLTRFTNKMIDELADLGYDVYVDDNVDKFLQLPDPKWLVDLSQLQLTESYYYEYLNTYSDDHPSVVKLRGNKLELATWIELNKANSNIKQTLYLESYIQDQVQDNESANTFFNYNFSPIHDSVGLKEVYRMADEAGEAHALLLFDHLLNSYVANNMPSQYGKWFHYEKFLGRITRTDYPKFEILK